MLVMFKKTSSRVLSKSATDLIPIFSESINNEVEPFKSSFNAAALANSVVESSIKARISQVPFSFPVLLIPRVNGVVPGTPAGFVEFWSSEL